MRKQKGGLSVSKILVYILALTLLSSCQIKSKRAESEKTPAAEQSTPVETEESKAADAEQAAETEKPHKMAPEMTINLKKDTRTAKQKDADEKEVAQNEAELSKVEQKQASAKETENHQRKAGPVAWDKALGWLKNGNTRFVKGNLRKDGQSKKDIKRLSKSQQPHSIILSCSDSRVPPEIAFDQKLGEIFVVRAAGEVLDSATIGSIEYAVEHLGSNLIVVMGHTSCGAVKAAHSAEMGGSIGSRALDDMIHDIQPRIKAYMGKPASQDYMKESWANVKGVAKDLYERSEIVRQALLSGQVKIAEALYDLDTGVVTFN
jgi:carbonic anhydrase